MLRAAPSLVKIQQVLTPLAGAGNYAWAFRKGFGYIFMNQSTGTDTMLREILNELQDCSILTQCYSGAKHASMFSLTICRIPGRAPQILHSNAGAEAYFSGKLSLGERNTIRAAVRGFLSLGMSGANEALDQIGEDRFTRQEWNIAVELASMVQKECQAA
jgi:hypothetical protein